MLKKTIKYYDFNDVERTEDHYFGLLESEITKKSLETNGGLVNKIQRAVDAKNMPELIQIMTEFIDMSYGIKSDDGKYFRKTPEALADFKASPAYDVLYMELVSDAKAASEFVNGIFPKALLEKAKQNPEFNNKMKELEQTE